MAALITWRERRFFLYSIMKDAVFMQRLDILYNVLCKYKLNNKDTHTEQQTRQKEIMFQCTQNRGLIKFIPPHDNVRCVLFGKITSNIQAETRAARQRA